MLIGKIFVLLHQLKDKTVPVKNRQLILYPNPYSE